MFQLGSKNLEKLVFLLLFLCVLAGAHGLGCSCGGGCGRRWLVVDRSSDGCRLVGGWSSVAGRRLVVGWSSAGRRLVVGRLSAGRRLVVGGWSVAGRRPVVGRSSHARWLDIGWSSVGGRLVAGRR